MPNSTVGVHLLLVKNTVTAPSFTVIQLGQFFELFVFSVTGTINNIGIQY